MTRLVLTRHGESEWHRDDRYAGRTDIGLTESGREQAELLATWASVHRPTVVAASPLRRCLDTAAAAAAALALEVVIEPDLVELDFGMAEGVARSDLVRLHPEEYAAFRADPVGAHFPGGEDPRAAASRVAEVLRRTAASARAADGTALVVGHSTALRLGLCVLLELPLRRYRSVLPSLDNGALTEVVVGADGGTGLASLNVPLAPHTSRLPEAPR